MPIRLQQSGDEASHWTSGLRSIADHIANRPMIRAMAARNAAQMQMYESRARQYQNQSALLAQRLSDLKVSGADREELRAAAEEAAPFLQSGDRSNPAVSRYAAIVGKVAAENRDHPAVQIFTALGLPQPSAQYAADKRNESAKYDADKREEASKYAADTKSYDELSKIGQNRYAPVMSGGAIYDKTTGKIIERNTSAAAGNAGNLMDTVEEDIPEQAAQPAVPADPGRPGIMGIGSRPATPGQPAVPGHGKMKITRRVQRGTPVDKIISGAQDTPTANAISATGVNVRGQAAPGEGSEETNPDVESTDDSPTAAPAPSAPASVPVAPATPQLADGTIIRHKKTGQQFVIKNGQPVALVEQQPDSGD